MEDKSIKGQIVKAIADRYTVMCDGKKYISSLSGKLKASSEVYVGDFVEIEGSKYGTNTINKLIPRDSLLIRPFVANVDALAIFATVIPPVDLLLVDKLIIDASRNGIEPIIIINKNELDGADELKQKIMDQYSSHVRIFSTSCLEGCIPEDLLQFFSGKLVALGGQSATGKTTLINLLLSQNQKVGEISSTLRGKHTTRHIEIFAEGVIRLVDTCGFSLLEFDMHPSQLASYYEDYVPYVSECKFKNKCTHTSEPECRIKQLIADGKLSQERYNRYLQLYAELKEKHDAKY